MAPPTSHPVDYAIAAGSLGLHLRRNAREFPRGDAYLIADEVRSAAWRARLQSLGTEKIIGISWRGGTQGTGRARRSLTLTELRPLLELPGNSWVSLQYGECAEEIRQFSEGSGIALHQYSGVTQDLDEFASLVGALDLVISVCNTTVHVAGALGKQVLVMAPFLPEWRYGLRGERMAWYSSAQVLRQPRLGDWQGVISAVKDKIGG